MRKIDVVDLFLSTLIYLGYVIVSLLTLGLMIFEVYSGFSNSLR